jgi:hypothetical protein
LPKLKQIREVLCKELLKKNDIISLKLLLDMYEDYSKTYMIDLYKEVINTILLFYYTITESDTENIYNSLRERSVAKIYKERILFRTKKEYIRYYRKEKVNIERMNNYMIKKL